MTLLLTIRRGADFSGHDCQVTRNGDLTIFKLDNGDEFWFDSEELLEAIAPRDNVRSMMDALRRRRGT